MARRRRPSGHTKSILNDPAAMAAARQAAFRNGSTFSTIGIAQQAQLASDTLARGTARQVLSKYVCNLEDQLANRTPVFNKLSDTPFTDDQLTELRGELENDQTPDWLNWEGDIGALKILVSPPLNGLGLENQRGIPGCNLHELLLKLANHRTAPGIAAVKKILSEKLVHTVLTFHHLHHAHGDLNPTNVFIEHENIDQLLTELFSGALDEAGIERKLQEELQVKLIDHDMSRPCDSTLDYPDHGQGQHKWLVTQERRTSRKKEEAILASMVNLIMGADEAEDYNYQESFLFPERLARLPQEERDRKYRLKTTNPSRYKRECITKLMDDFEAKQSSWKNIPGNEKLAETVIELWGNANFEPTSENSKPETLDVLSKPPQFQLSADLNLDDDDTITDLETTMWHIVAAHRAAEEREDTPYQNDSIFDGPVYKTLNDIAKRIPETVKSKFSDELKIALASLPASIARVTITADDEQTEYLAKVPWPSLSQNLGGSRQAVKFAETTNNAEKSKLVRDAILQFGPTQNTTAKKAVDLARQFRGEKPLHVKLTGEKKLRGKDVKHKTRLSPKQKKMKSAHNSMNQDARFDRYADSFELLELMEDLTKGGKEGCTLLDLQTTLAKYGPAAEATVEKIKFGITQKMLAMVIKQNNLFSQGDLTMTNIVAQFPDMDSKLAELCANGDEGEIQQFIDGTTLSLIDFDTARPADELDSKFLGYTKYHDGSGNGQNSGYLLLPELHSTRKGQVDSTSRQKELYQAGIIATSFLLSKNSVSKDGGLFVTEMDVDVDDSFAEDLFQNDETPDGLPELALNEDGHVTNGNAIREQQLENHLSAVNQRIDDIQALPNVDSDAATHLATLLRVMTSDNPAQRQPSFEQLESLLGTKEAQSTLSSRMACQVDLDNPNELSRMEAEVDAYILEAKKAVKRKKLYETSIGTMPSGEPRAPNTDIKELYVGPTIPVDRLGAVLPLEFIGRTKHNFLGSLSNQEIATLAHQYATTNRFDLLAELAKKYINLHAAAVRKGEAEADTEKLYKAFIALQVFDRYNLSYVGEKRSRDEVTDLKAEKVTVLRQYVAELFPNPAGADESEGGLAQRLEDGMINCYQSLRQTLNKDEAITATDQDNRNMLGKRVYTPSSDQATKAMKGFIYFLLILVSIPLAGLPLLYFAVKPKAYNTAKAALDTLDDSLDEPAKSRASTPRRNSESSGTRTPSDSFCTKPSDKEDAKTYHGYYGNGRSLFQEMRRDVDGQATKKRKTDGRDRSDSLDPGSWF